MTSLQDAVAQWSNQNVKAIYEQWSLTSQRHKRYDWGFDVTHFGNDWPKVVSALNLHYLGALNDCFVWVNARGLELCTQNNPETGTFHDPDKRKPERGFASYIGLSGPQIEISFAVRTIKHFAVSIKSESPNKRSFI